MTALAEVQIRETCPECEGRGIVMNAEWGVYWADAEQQQREKALRDAGERGQAADLYTEWWRHRGYTIDMDYEGGVFKRSRHHVPQEEEPCSECEGTGKRSRWVNVREFSQMLWLREALAEEGVS